MHDLVELKLAVYLELCHDIEATVADLYHFFAARFKHDKDVRALWHKTAMEEECHAQEFMMASQRHIDMVAGDQIQLEDARNLLARLRGVLDHVVECPPSVDKALQLAMVEEENLMSFHIHSASGLVTDACRSVFTAMMFKDREHVERMKKLAHQQRPG